MTKAKFLLPVLAFGASAPAFAAGATGPDFTALTDAINFDTTQGVILSVGALVIGLSLVMVGVRVAKRMVRSA